jgi:hypothetical protein
MVRAAVAKLPERYRHVVVLSFDDILTESKRNYRNARRNGESYIFRKILKEYLVLFWKTNNLETKN